MTTNITAMAQHQPYNPWSLPDSFTIYNFAPEEIRSFLHPHWHNQKAPHPMLYYFFGLLYTVIGKLQIEIIEKITILNFLKLLDWRCI